MGTIKKYATPAGREGYIARDSWTDPATGQRLHKKARFPKKAARNLRQCEDEAKAWLAQREADRSRGVLFEPSREPFGAAVDRWLRLIDTPKRSQRTIGLYRSVARLRLASVRTVPVCELTTARLRGLMAEWERAELSAATITHGLLVVRGVFTLLLDEGAVLRSPVESVARPRRDAAAPPTWTPEQVRQFLLSQADDPFAFAWQLLFAALLRIGELTALRWEDIDAAGVLTITRTWTLDADERPVMGERGKSASAIRRIPLSPDLMARLELIRASRDWDDEGWIIATPRVQPLRPSGLRKLWNAAVTASGITPAITPHGARHSGATALIAAGVPVTAVQKLLGHRRAGFTLDRYVHAGADESTAAATALRTLYGSENQDDCAQCAPNVVSIGEKRRIRGTYSG